MTNCKKERIAFPDADKVSLQRSIRAAITPTLLEMESRETYPEMVALIFEACEIADAVKISAVKRLNESSDKYIYYALIDTMGCIAQVIAMQIESGGFSSSGFVIVAYAMASRILEARINFDLALECDELYSSSHGDCARELKRSLADRT